MGCFLGRACKLAVCLQLFCKRFGAWESELKQPELRAVELCFEGRTRFICSVFICSVLLLEHGRCLSCKLADYVERRRCLLELRCVIADSWNNASESAACDESAASKSAAIGSDAV